MTDSFREGGTQKWTLSKSRENKALLDITSGYSRGQDPSILLISHPSSTGDSGSEKLHGWLSSLTELMSVSQMFLEIATDSG